MSAQPPNGSGGCIRLTLLDETLPPLNTPPPARTGTEGVAWLVVDESGRILEVEEGAARLLGRSQADLLSARLGDVLPQVNHVVLELARRATEAGRSLVIEAQCAGAQTPSAALELVLAELVPTAAQPLLRFQVRPRLASRLAEQEIGSVEARIARAERLASAGTLASQIAHDFHNLLTPLLAYPELIRRQIPDHPEVSQHLDVIEHTVSDMTYLTDQLLSLSRRERMDAEVLCLNRLVEEMMRLLQPVLPKTITVEFDLAEDLLPVMGSRAEIVRMIHNLCQNAIDAMPESGRLTIKTENVYLDAPVGKYNTVNVGEYVKLSIADTGTGIPEAIRDKIFDPFFTTKKLSQRRGSGLGLSIVHGIIQDHGGYVDLETVVGQGTTFYVYLPIHRAISPEPARQHLPRGSESILVVDDDPLQLEVLVNMLRALGYRAHHADSGEEALRLHVRDGCRFDLILLDMILKGGMDGLATFTELRRLVPNQKVMLISGFSQATPDVASAQRQGAGTYLRKPVTLERLAHAVRNELDGMPNDRGKVRRILIVDDEQQIRKLLGMILTADLPNVAVDQAANGREAVERFAASRHDLIIMDLQMPTLDGRETFSELAQLCEQQGWSMPPVIFCTGYSPPDSLRTILTAGSKHCVLRKPVPARTLVDAVRQRL